VTTQFALPLEIIQTNRKKTASIEIKNNSIKVIVPKTLSEDRIKALIQQRASWIEKKIRTQAEMPPFRPKEYVNGEDFTYLGKNYRLKRITSNTKETKLKNGYLHVPVNQNASPSVQEKEINASLTQWYKTHALKKLQQKTDRYAKQMNVTPRSVTVKDYKARWGSCSTSGDITYNWKIIMAPHRIVDYVVVHELAHLLEHNHSDKYWKHVENMMTDFRERREWLKINANTLVV